MYIIIIILGWDQEKRNTKLEDIIHRDLLRLGGGGGATHDHFNATIEGKEQFYYCKRVMFREIIIELVQILKLTNTNINPPFYPFFITLYLLLYLSDIHRVREGMVRPDGKRAGSKN